jgi:hypothetical protein
MALIDVTNEKYKYYFLPLLLIILILFIGLRYNTGDDFNTYVELFEGSLANATSYEVGYLLLNKIFRFFCRNYYIMQFSITFFVCTIVYIFISKYSRYRLISLFIFVSQFGSHFLMATVRQSLAVAIVVLSIKFIFNKKPLSFLLMVLLASTFHVSAIAALPLYILNKKINKLVLILILLISIFISGYARAIIVFILSIIAVFFSNIFPNPLLKVALSYLNPENPYFILVRSIGLYDLVVILFLLILIMRNSEKDSEKNFFINTMVVSVVISNISLGFLALGRLAVYYSIFNVVTYTYLLRVFNFKKVQELVIIYAFCLFLFISYPYLSFFKNDKINDFSGRPANITYVPYYNVLIHPMQAQYRKDNAHSR